MLRILNLPLPRLRAESRLYLFPRPIENLDCSRVVLLPYWTVHGDTRDDVRERRSASSAGLIERLPSISVWLCLWNMTRSFAASSAMVINWHEDVSLQIFFDEIEKLVVTFRTTFLRMTWNDVDHLPLDLKQHLFYKRRLEDRHCLPYERQMDAWKRLNSRFGRNRLELHGDRQLLLGNDGFLIYSMTRSPKRRSCSSSFRNISVEQRLTDWKDIPVIFVLLLRGKNSSLPIEQAGGPHQRVLGLLRSINDDSDKNDSNLSEKDHLHF